MAKDDLLVEAHIKVTDDLGAALTSDAKLIDQLGVKLREHLANLAELGGRLSIDGGFAKLTGALKPTGLISELEQIRSKIGAFKAAVKSIGMSDDAMRNGARLAAPLDTATNRARTNVRGLKTRPGVVSTAEKRETRSAALATSHSAPPEKPIPAIDRARAILDDNRKKIGTVEMLASPATEIIQEADAVVQEFIRAQIRGRISKDALEPLMKAAQEARQETQLPPVAEAQILSMLAEKFGKDPGTLAKLLPIFSNFADAQMLMNKTPYGVSAENLLKLVEVAGINSPDQIGEMAQMLNRASWAIPPGGSDTLSQMVGSSLGALKALPSVTDQDVFLANVAAMRSGAPRSANLADVLIRATGHLSTGMSSDPSTEALTQIGLFDQGGIPTAFVKDHFDFQKFLEIVAAFEAATRDKYKDAPGRAQQEITATLLRAFGPNAGLVAAMATPESINSTKDLAQNFNSVRIEDVQKEFDQGSVERQLDKAKASLEQTLVQLGRDVLPIVNQQLQKFNGHIIDFNNWMADHKAVSKNTGLLTVFGSLGLSALLSSTLRGGLFRFAGNPWGLAGLAAAGGLYASATVGTQQAKDLNEHLPLQPGETEYQRQLRLFGMSSADGVRILPTLPFNHSAPTHDQQTAVPTPPPPLPSPSGPHSRHHINFAMPGDQRGPTLERAVALSTADTPGKQPPLNVQVQPGKVIVNLDGRTIATAVMEFMARQVGGPNTGPTDFNTAGRFTPPGIQAGASA